MLRRRDYDEFSEAVPWEEEVRPFLFGFDRGEIGHSTSIITLAFAFPRPRFGFSLGEQGVLEKALLGATDEDIAKALELSVWAIKKRWQTLYEKVEKIDPLLLETAGDGRDEKGEATRVRRRLLLDYLRNHLEELRPFSHQRGRKGTKEKV